MTETLLHFILQRLDQIECPVFLHRELERFPEEQLRALRADGILRETSRATEIPRPKNIPSGEDLVVRHTSKGIFGVADEEDYFDPIPLTEDDVRQYEISLPKLTAVIRQANGIGDSGFVNHHGLIPMGKKAVDGSGNIDVFFSMPNLDENEFIARCRRLEQLCDASGIVILTPRTIALSPENRQQMKRLGIITVAITTNSSPNALSLDWLAISRQANSQVVHYADDGGQVSLEDEAIKVPVNTITEEDKIVVERKKVGERIHWFVNGVDKGHIFVRQESISAKITEILYDQIGHGWVPHKTFMNACAWKEDEYFPASGEPGRMQRQLNIIRKNLGVAIEFRKGKGVRFAENIVKSK
ncbi:hypothetical protein [Desulfococcus sp.]|uniref:hypothetical protein n=1 Tax=Desulfococcus sp. TaxID=2025834 RepID=UPI003D11F5AB